MQEAILTSALMTSGGSYNLDWGNNLLGDCPPLVVNDVQRGRWSIFDIFLDVIRITNPTFIKYNNVVLRERFLECYKMALFNTCGFGIDQFSYSISDSVEDIILCDIWQDYLTVININYDY